MGVITSRKPSLPTRFVPRFIDEQDGRLALVREMRNRFEQLKQHAGADSMQKDLLCQRAIFLSIQLETFEADAAAPTENSRPFDANVYAQMVNTLSGILKALGLERKDLGKGDLSTYLESKRK